MRSAPRLVIVALLGLLLALSSVLPAGPAAAVAVAAPAVSAADEAVAQPPTTTTRPPASSPGATAPSGPKLEPESENDQAESRRKLIMGVASVALVGLVLWGRSVRSKRRKKMQGG
jgi:hypothetical protein